MREVVIVDGIRTAFMKAGTTFSNLGVVELGVIILQELLWRNSLKDEQIDEIIVGNGCQPIDAANPARVIAERAGLRKNGFQRIPAYTVQRNCASGLEAICAAYKEIALRRRDLVVVLGIESMSNSILLYPETLKNLWLELAGLKKNTQRLQIFLKLALQTQKQLIFTLLGKKKELPISALELGLRDPVINLMMGDTADHLSREFQISREEQDRFSLSSHLKASKADKEGVLAQEIVPVFVPRFKMFVKNDNGIRHNQTLEALAKLRPFFDKKFGTVTAGNSSQITDGAAGLVITRKEIAEKYKLPILGKIIDFEFVGCPPLYMGLGPVLATSKLLAKTGLKLEQMDLIEINEAFAAQILSVIKLFEKEGLGKIDLKKLNVNGGAIALGHPIGATGVRMVLTLLKEMQRRQVPYGLATLCIGGGQGGAMLLKREVKNGD